MYTDGVTELTCSISSGSLHPFGSDEHKINWIELILYVHDRVLCTMLTGHWYGDQNKHFQTEGKSGGKRVSSTRNWGRYLGTSSTLK